MEQMYPKFGNKKKTCRKIYEDFLKIKSMKLVFISLWYKREHPEEEKNSKRDLILSNFFYLVAF